MQAEFNPELLLFKKLTYRIDDTMESTLGKTIKRRLKDIGMKQYQLAELVNVSNAAVTKWMTNGTISRENAMVVADILKISVDELLGVTSKDYAKNEFERQLLYFYRGLSEDNKDYILLKANKLFNQDSPGDIASDPFNKKTKKEIEQ